VKGNWNLSCFLSIFSLRFRMLYNFKILIHTSFMCCTSKICMPRQQTKKN
jgi:hypothetical protein